MMSQKKYLVTLTPDERDHLENLLDKGKASALVLTRARILLKADQADGGPALDDAAIAEDLEVGLRTISRVRERFVERGFEDCVRRQPQTSRAGSGPSTAPPIVGQLPRLWP